VPADRLLGALSHVWRTLEPLQLPIALMGGIAVAVWKHVRATQDIDLLVGIGTTEPNTVLQRLMAAGIRPKRQPPLMSLGQLRLLQLLYEPKGAYLEVQIDLLLGDSAYHREALSRRVPIQLPGLDVEVAVLACEDLILHKLIAGRILDQADSAALLRANRDSLDVSYLAHWASELGTAADLAAVWQEALPDEQPPVP
jgi:hypothetical protein